MSATLLTVLCQASATVLAFASVKGQELLAGFPDAQRSSMMALPAHVYRSAVFFPLIPMAIGGLLFCSLFSCLRDLGGTSATRSVTHSTKFTNDEATGMTGSSVEQVDRMRTRHVDDRAILVSLAQRLGSDG